MQWLEHMNGQIPGLPTRDSVGNDKEWRVLCILHFCPSPDLKLQIVISARGILHFDFFDISVRHIALHIRRTHIFLGAKNGQELSNSMYHPLQEMK